MPTIAKQLHDMPFTDSFWQVPNCRRDMGTFRLGHASSPSMGRSVADVLSAHGPMRKVPMSRLGQLDSGINKIFV